ncbi:hypothetical protein NX059_003684 [Plenodomus lindquistii]|nr:hypothetical protein NX059_003684 [Plenodomus lindquistii]
MIAGAKKMQDEEQVKSITLLNQETSPLLRIPGELRDLIYTYAFSGSVLEKGVPTDPAHTIVQDEPLLPKLEARLPTILGVLGVCRQIYYEARFLLFRLVDLRILDLDSAEDDLYQRITATQWDLITTIRLRAAQLRMFCINCREPFCPSIEKELSLLRKNRLEILSHTPGLQRVVLEDWRRRSSVAMDTEEKDWVASVIRKSVDDRKLEVVFELGFELTVRQRYLEDLSEDDTDEMGSVDTDEDGGDDLHEGIDDDLLSDPITLEKWLAMP